MGLNVTRRYAILSLFWEGKNNISSIYSFVLEIVFFFVVFLESLNSRHRCPLTTVRNNRTASIKKLNINPWHLVLLFHLSTWKQFICFLIKKNTSSMNNLPMVPAWQLGEEVGNTHGPAFQ